MLLVKFRDLLINFFEIFWGIFFEIKYSGTSYSIVSILIFCDSELLNFVLNESKFGSNPKFLIRFSSKKIYKIIQFFKWIELINSSKDLYITSFGWESGNKMFRIEHKEIKAEVFSLLLKYNGAIGFISSLLK